MMITAEQAARIAAHLDQDRLLENTLEEIEWAAKNNRWGMHVLPMLEDTEFDMARLKHHLEDLGYDVTSSPHYSGSLQLTVTWYKEERYR